MNNTLQILNKYFGYDSFRTGQLEIIEAILNYNNIIVVLPTGAGKSICYQVPALISENFSIVISPLIALMKDQVDSLNKREEIAAFINSTMSYSESEQVINKISFGKIKLLYLAPEKLESLKFADRIKELKPSHLFIDEAHCISEWGHNFRPSYLKIKEFITHASIKKISAFTATATPEVVEDIVHQLGLKEPKIFVRGFERDNLHINVHITKNKKKKCADLLKEISGSAIVYTSSRKKAEEVAEHLNMNGIACSYYHAGLTGTERRRIQEEFINGENNLIVATNAFGMGIDKKDIRLVIHYNIPGSIENYYQEIGRAGRDGYESFVHLFYADKDIAIQNHFISSTHPNKELIQKTYQAICDYNRVAVGSLPEKELIVDREYISNYAGVKVSKGLLHSALKYLENAGYLKQVSEYEKKDTIQFLVDKEKLKRFVKNSTHQKLKNAILLLLREFGSSIFNSAAKTSTHNLSAALNLPELELVDSLIILDNLGIVSFKQAIPKETVMLTTARVNHERLFLNYKMINESYLNSQKKLDKMMGFVFTQECRFKYILNYFGEKLDEYKCGKCDNCEAANRITDSALEYYSEVIIVTLDEAKEEIPEKALFQILRGEDVKESFKMFNNFGACRNSSLSDLKIVLQELISKGRIFKSSNKRNYLSLSDRKAGSPDKEIEKPETPDKKIERPEAVNNNYDWDLYLFNLLKEARKKASERFIQSGYLICADDILRQVVKRKPKTKYEMLSINGFSDRMFNKLGNDFLEIIIKYIKEKPELEKKSNKHSAASALPQNINETKRLLEKKYTLQEIAELRKLSEAVISMQIETIIEYYPETDLGHLFDKKEFDLIISEAEKGFENLKELKERLPSSISYPRIRIATAKLRVTSRV